jgi:uncharacterized protein (DUF849 family)
LLHACLNGGRSRAEARGLPITPAEVARDARATGDAGIVEQHVLPSDADRAAAQSIPARREMRPA